MESTPVVIGRFGEVDRAADALEGLRLMGIPEDEVEVISGYPYSPEMLGRPHRKTILPYISLGSALVGFLVGLFMTAATPSLYIVRVGGQPVVPIPPTALLQFEFTMIFLILGTFLGFLWLNSLPALGPAHYDAKVSDGEIGLIVRCSPNQLDQVTSLLQSQQAANVQQSERRAP